MVRDHAADAALDVVEAQKLKALGIRNSIEAEIGAVAAAPASFLVSSSLLPSFRIVIVSSDRNHRFLVAVPCPAGQVIFVLLFFVAVAVVFDKQQVLRLPGLGHRHGVSRSL